MTTLRKDGHPKLSGGKRKGAGKPKLPDNERKKQHSFRVADKDLERVKEAIKEITKKKIG